MSASYTEGGKRRSSQTHARRSHTCDFCSAVTNGNGGKVAHARKHVRSGEAVELVKWHSHTPSPSRVFLPADDTVRIEAWLMNGFTLEER